MINTVGVMDNSMGYSYFGARYYDSDLSVWLSVDPLSDKHPNLTPYNYCSNRPIVSVDPDGRDGIVVVDNETSTLTVTAIYYVPTKRLSDVPIPMYNSTDIANLNTIDNFLNKKHYQVTEGEYSGYNVKFDLQFIESGNTVEATDKLGTDIVGGNPISNTFDKSSAKYRKDFVRTEKGVVGGITNEEHNQIVMNSFADGLDP